MTKLYSRIRTERLDLVSFSVGSKCPAAYWVAMTHPIVPWVPPSPVTMATIVFVSHAQPVLHEITTISHEMRKGYGLETLRALMLSYGMLNAGWETVSGVALATKYQERFGKVPEWDLSPDPIPDEQAGIPLTQEQIVNEIERSRHLAALKGGARA